MSTEVFLFPFSLEIVRMAPNTHDAVVKPSDQISSDDQNSVRSRLLNGKTFDENQNESSHTSHSKVSQTTSENPDDKVPFHPKIRWPDLIAQVFIHGGSIYGLYYLITLKAAFYTYVWCKTKSKSH
jgi:hypothetical protein